VKERKKEKTHSLQGIALNKAPENPIRPPITAAQILERFLQQRTSLCLTHFRNSQENEKKKKKYPTSRSQQHNSVSGALGSESTSKKLSLPKCHRTHHRFRFQEQIRNLFLPNQKPAWKLEDSEVAEE
jgi:hypothetical protein